MNNAEPATQAAPAAPTSDYKDFQLHGEPQQLAALYLALSKAQAEFSEVLKTRTVTVQPKDKQSYTFDYAPLETVIAATRPALNKHGLAVLQPLSRAFDGVYLLRTLLMHSDGAYIEALAFFSDVAMGKDGPYPLKMQDIGSAVTYMRRYAYQSLVFVNSEDDDDANSADGNQAQVLPPRQGRPPARPPQANRSEPPKQEREPSRTERIVEGQPLSDVTKLAMQGAMQLRGVEDKPSAIRWLVDILQRNEVSKLSESDGLRVLEHLKANPEYKGPA